MSDENRELESGDTGSSALPTVGSQLKAAREAKQMSVGDIAMALKLGPRQVEALESGNWHGLPGHTFIRGFVRNYARLLQLDVGALMAQLDAGLETPQQRLSLPGKTQAPMPQMGSPRRRDMVMVGAGISLVVLAIGIYFLLPADLSAVTSRLQSLASVFSSSESAPAPAVPAAAPAAPAPAAEPVFPPGVTPQQVLNPQAVPVPENAAPPALVPPPVLAPSQPAAAPAPSPAAAGVPAAAPAAPGAASAGAAPLVLAFQQESWVEVRDRDGKVVFSQRNAAGTEKTVEGRAPFSLVIGNAPGVKVSRGGQPVNLAPYTNGNVARLTLE